MIDTQLFDDFLLKNEKVVSVNKPNRFKWFMGSFIACTVFAIIFGLMMAGAITVEEGPEFLARFVAFAFMAIIIYLLWLIYLPLSIMRYRKTFYIVTDLRVIRRHGIFGVCYVSLDVELVGVAEAKVSLLDKILRKKTGTIRIASVSQHMGIFFSHQPDVYAAYKELKSHIDEVKTQKKSVLDQIIR